MGHRARWKTVFVRDGNELGRLRSVAQNLIYRPGWMIDWQSWSLETNLPWRELRRMFRLAGVPWSHAQFVTSKLPTWEDVTDNEEQGGYGD